MLRVLVAEDSNTARELLVAMLRSDPGIDVVGEAKNGVEVVAMTKRLRPDVVTMDVQMPLMDGFEATKTIMVETPTPIVIVTATLDVNEVATSMQALKAGALTVLAKPPGPLSPRFDEERGRFLSTVKAMAQVKVVRHWARDPVRTAPAFVASDPLRVPRIVAIAASTGGPAALSAVLSTLPRGFPQPILVVQHMAHGFIGGFASWLRTVVSLDTKLAVDGERLERGTIYIGPDDRHLGVDTNQRIVISSSPHVGGFRPSASYLFSSVANVFGSGVLSVVLTGMGSDGLEGLHEVKQAGGRVIAQDEASSIVFGMPGAAVAAGLADSILPLETIGPRILQVAGSRREP